jgi:hypothetical protein
MSIETTGSARTDTATSEIALALRSGHPGHRDQYYYDWAMRLRDEIMAGTREQDETTAPGAYPMLPPHLEERYQAWLAAEILKDA